MTDNVTPATDEQIAEIERLANKATLKDYRISPHTTVDKSFMFAHICEVDYDDVDHNQIDRDILYIQGACLMIPALIARIRELGAKNDEYVWAGNDPFTGEQVLALLNENEKLRKDIQEIYELVTNLPGGVDPDADPLDPSPADAVVHIGGLIWQICKNVIRK